MPPHNTDNIRKVNEAILRARVALADVEGVFLSGGDDPLEVTGWAYLNCVVTLLAHAQDYWRDMYEDSLSDLGFAA